MASLRRATSNIAAQIVSLAAGFIDRIVLVGLLLRAWGAETFADYAIVQSWAALLLMVELGAQIYFQNEEQRAFVRDDKPRFRRMAATHLGLSLAVVVPLAMLFTLLVASGGADAALHRPNFDLGTRALDALAARHRQSAVGHARAGERGVFGDRRIRLRDADLRRLGGGQHAGGVRRREPRREAGRRRGDLFRALRPRRAAVLPYRRPRAAARMDGAARVANRRRSF